MGKLIIIGGKKFRSTGANEVIEHNTNEDLNNFFYGNSIEARWTRHIQNINEQLKTQQYKAGRPRKETVIESESQMGI